MEKIAGNRMAAICCMIGAACIGFSQAVRSAAVVFWMAALIAFVVALGFASSAYVQHKQQNH